MKVLIELFDTEQIYNYIATLVFKPEKVYFVGDSKIMGGNCRIKAEKLTRLKDINAKFLYKFVNSVDFHTLRASGAPVGFAPKGGYAYGALAPGSAGQYCWPPAG